MQQVLLLILKTLRISTMHFEENAAWKLTELEKTLTLLRDYLKTTE